MRVYKAPESIANASRFIFLAGSIEMGTAEMWQDKATRLLQEASEESKAMGRYMGEFDVVNPRRDDWDSSWKQEYDNPQFNQQVTWELHCIKKASVVLFYFDPSTKSPITLLELGFVAGMRQLGGKKAVVVCPEEFYRKGNVDVLCHLNGIEQFDNLEEAVKEIVKYI